MINLPFYSNLRQHKGHTESPTWKQNHVISLDRQKVSFHTSHSNSPPNLGNFKLPPLRSPQRPFTSNSLHPGHKDGVYQGMLKVGIDRHIIFSLWLLERDNLSFTLFFSRTSSTELKDSCSYMQRKLIYLCCVPLSQLMTDFQSQGRLLVSSCISRSW